MQHTQNKPRKTACGKSLAVGYVRVSTKDQGESGISLDAQKAAIETFADLADYSLIEIFEDIGSGVGERSLASRPGLRSAMEMARKENAYFLVWNWDRLSRYSHFPKQVRRYFSSEDQVICVMNGMKMIDAAKRAAFEHSEHQAKEISRRTAEGMKRKKAEGKVFGNPDIRTKVQPLGTEASKKKTHERYLKIADILRNLPDPFSDSYAEIAEILNSRGLRTQRNLAWDKHKARGPVKKAREILRDEENELLKSNPLYGMF